MAANIFDLQDTWNNSGTVFYAIKMNVTTTAFAAGSKLLELESNGVHQFSVDPSQGVRVGNPAGGTTGPGTINISGSYCINGSSIDNTFAKLSSPVFIGDPQAPTQPNADNDSSIATTAFVKNVAQPLDADLTSLAAASAFGAGPVPSGLYYRKAANTWAPLNLVNLTIDTGTDTLTGGAGGGGGGIPEAPIDSKYYGRRNSAWADLSLVYQPIGSYAPLASPVFTGDPQAPTPAAADNDTSIATTAFVKAQAYATLASPIFTGDPRAPTPTAGDNDTSVATTAFVQGAVTASLSGYVLKAGDVMTGNLQIATSGPVNLVLNELGATGSAQIYFDANTKPRWNVTGATPAAETGSGNTGSDFSLGAFADDGATPIGTALFIKRSTLLATVAGDPTANLGIATKQYVDTKAATLQPLDADLTAIAGLTGTNTIYYRSGTDAWSPVTIGAGLTFSSGTLAAPATGGNVSSSGTPANGQWAQWTDATHIQGIATASMPFVQKAGDTMTGDLLISKSNPQCILNATGTNDVAPITFQNSGSPRWGVYMDGTAESGSNTGSNFQISRYNDAGAGIDSPITIARNTGLITVVGDPTAALGVATKQYVDTRAGVSPRCGRLIRISDTAMQFAPYNGDKIMINGVMYTIPAGGIQGLANLGSVYYNGTPGTVLPFSPGTMGVTYVYAFSNAGVVTADFSQTAYAVGNNGTMIKSGDNTRTLIGICWNNTGALPPYGNATVVSWFNRQPRVLSASFANFVWSSTSITTAATVLCCTVAFTGEPVKVDLNTIAQNSVDGQYGIVQVRDSSGAVGLQRTCLAAGNVNPNDFLYEYIASDFGSVFSVWVQSSSTSNTFSLANSILTVTVGAAGT